MTRVPVATIAVALVFATTPALAAPIVVTASGPNGTFAAAVSDLMNQGEPTLTSVVQTGGAALFGSSLAKVNDGSVYNGGAVNDSDHTFIASNGSTFDVTFDTALNPFGYNLTSIQSIAGAGGSPDQDRVGQVYSVEASLVGSAAFFSLASVNFGTPNTGETQVTITDSSGILAIGVDVLRFTIFDDVSSPHAQTMYREFDVQGVAATAVPEPASLLLFGSGTAALAARLRRRRVAQG